MNNFEIVAKFGGTSVARPDFVRKHVGLEEPDIIVVSALGQDRRRNIGSRVTELLRAFRWGGSGIGAIRERHDNLIADMGLSSGTIGSPAQQIFEDLAQDIETWTNSRWPLECLGEYWSARLYGAYLDREFVDAAEVIRADEARGINIQASAELAESRFVPGRRYVVPGFYGADSFGRILSLGRGASDVTAALLARVLDASEYHIWSDVDGYMTADPAVSNNAVLIPEVDIQDAETWAQDGCQLVHPEVYSLLGDTAVKIVLRNTFGLPNNRGTEVLRRSVTHEYARV